MLLYKTITVNFVPNTAGTAPQWSTFAS